MAIKNFYTGVYIGDNLGIGVDAPASKLHVNGNVLLSNNNELRWLSSTGTQESILELNASDLLSLTGPGRIRIVPDGNAAIDLFSGHNTKYVMSSVHSWEDNNSNVALRITAGGNVGIGTTNPGAKLDVSTTAIIGSSSGTGTLTIGNTLSNPGSIMKMLGYTSTYKNWQLGNGLPTGGVFSITPSTTNGGTTFTTPSFVIDTNSNVGIGTTTPKAKLDVNGGVKVANDTDAASANKAGTLRYRYLPDIPKSQSKVDMCMQTGTNSYAWVNIVTNTWNN